VATTTGVTLNLHYRQTIACALTDTFESAQETLVNLLLNLTGAKY
jgi:hypothetical protein